MLDTSDYPDVVWQEEIGDTMIHYSDGNRIVALCPNDKFYTLTEAFGEGYLTAEDIAAIACFLFSDDASYLNGAVIRADGGITVNGDVNR